MKAIILSSLVFLLSCGEVYNSDGYSQSTLSHMSNPSIVNYSRWRTLPEYQLSEPNFQLTVGDMYTVCNGEGTTYRISRNGKKLSKITCDANNNMTVEHEVITEEDKWYDMAYKDSMYINGDWGEDEGVYELIRNTDYYGRRTLVWKYIEDSSQSIDFTIKPNRMYKIVDGAVRGNDYSADRCYYDSHGNCVWVPIVVKLCEEAGKTWIEYDSDKNGDVDSLYGTTPVGSRICEINFNDVPHDCQDFGVTEQCEVMSKYPMTCVGGESGIELFEYITWCEYTIFSKCDGGGVIYVIYGPLFGLPPDSFEVNRILFVRDPDIPPSEGARYLPAE